MEEEKPERSGGRQLEWPHEELKGGTHRIWMTDQTEVSCTKIINEYFAKSEEKHKFLYPIDWSQVRNQEYG